MGRGSSLVYGKISLASEGESMDKLIDYLKKVLSTCGYPEKKKEDEGDEDIQSAEDLKKLVKESGPAKDSIVAVVEEKKEEYLEEDDDVEDFHPDDEP
jgi:hypothetical protein